MQILITITSIWYSSLWNKKIAILYDTLITPPYSLLYKCVQLQTKKNTSESFFQIGSMIICYKIN